MFILFIWVVLYVMFLQPLFILMCPYTCDFHWYGRSWGKDVLGCWDSFREDLIYPAFRVCIDPCWYFHIILIPADMFLFKLYGHFVNHFHILLYVKVIVFTCVVYSTTFPSSLNMIFLMLHVCFIAVILAGIYIHGF